MADARRTINKIVLAYSGGLDTSVILHWLKAKYDCPVVALCVDVGQQEDFAAVEQKALRSGADKFVLADCKAEFVKDFVFPAIKGKAIYEDYYLLGTSLARPIIAKALVETARREGCDAIAHGATGKGNDQVRFELTAYTLMPEIKVIAPWRDWDMKSREDLFNYCDKYNITVTSTRQKPYSMDHNVMHISYEGGILEDPWLTPTEDMFQMTVSADKAPDEPRDIEITYEKGIAVAVDGVRMAPLELLQHCNKLGGEHGVGRVDLVENRFVGIKSRGVYETPGAEILHHGHRAVESITLDREVKRLRDANSAKFTELVYYGFWYSPEMQHLLKLNDDVQEIVNGVAKLRLFKGSCRVIGRKAKYPLYNQQYSTFEADNVYNQADADGFIKLHALRLKLHSLRERKIAADGN
ncbi:MAG: argininosuccinate synthase [Myxococcales bacterium]|nr:argininosuccinate synthase [Myxococcales bacterium]